MKANTVYILSRDPFVVTGCFATLEQLRSAARPFIFLYHNAGWLRPRNLPRYLSASRAYRGNRRLIVIANELSEARWLRLVGVESYAISHNIHVREGFFCPREGLPKRYDAVYSAQLAAFKRLALAKSIPKICVVTYMNGAQEWNLHDYEPALRHAVFNRTFIPPEQVRDIYNASAVGLALSAKEGAMFASMEYLMCGLPVVTTRNRGGRNRYLTPCNSRVVAARPDAVARAVAAYVASPPETAAIRKETLGLMHRDRLAYVDILRRRCGVRFESPELEVERLWGGESGIEKHALSVADFIASQV